MKDHLLNFSQPISDQLQEIMLQRNRYSNSWIVHEYILATENIFNIQANRYMEKIVVKNTSRNFIEKIIYFCCV